LQTHSSFWQLSPSPQVRPQAPQLALLDTGTHAPAQFIWPTGQPHSLHSQRSLQVRPPPLAQGICVPGSQLPGSLQADQSVGRPVLRSQPRVRMPQLPHASIVSPGQLCPLHSAAHWQSPPQVRVPPLPQAWVVPGSHAPCPSHCPNSDQVPVFSSHSRVWVPHIAQARVGDPGQLWSAHGPHWQLPLQV